MIAKFSQNPAVLQMYHTRPPSRFQPSNFYDKKFFENGPHWWRVHNKNKERKRCIERRVRPGGHHAGGRRTGRWFASREVACEQEGDLQEGRWRASREVLRAGRRLASRQVPCEKACIEVAWEQEDNLRAGRWLACRKVECEKWDGFCVGNSSVACGKRTERWIGWWLEVMVDTGVQSGGLWTGWRLVYRSRNLIGY